MSTAPETTAPAEKLDHRPPTISRTIAGAGHIGVLLAHWAGGHTVSEEEILRRIVKARSEAHAVAVTDHAAQAKAAHRRALRLKRSAAENGGLTADRQTALAAAELEAQRHDAALSALGTFTVPVLDPGHVRHRRHRIAAWRCTMLLAPVAGILAASWLWSGGVFLVSVVSGTVACALRGHRPFDLGVRPVPAELLAATPMVLPIAPAVVQAPEPAAPEALPVDTSDWREELRLHVEHAVAAAELEGRKGVHAVDLLHGLQRSGRYLGLTGSAFPAKLRDAGLPVTGISIKGDNQLGVRHDQLAAALGRSPRLPSHLVPDRTDYSGTGVVYGSEKAPLGTPSPAKSQSA